MSDWTPEGSEPLSAGSRIVVHLGAEDHRLLKIEAARQERTVTGMARFILREYLKDVRP